MAAFTKETKEFMDCYMKEISVMKSIQTLFVQQHSGLNSIYKDHYVCVQPSTDSSPHANVLESFKRSECTFNKAMNLVPPNNKLYFVVEFDCDGLYVVRSPPTVKSL